MTSDACLWGLGIAEQIHALAARLLEAEHQQAPLPVLVEHAESLAKEVECYTAAAVHDARAKGSGWEAVAAACGVGTETARTRWSESRVQRLLARRARERVIHPSWGAGGRRPAALGEGRSLPAPAAGAGPAAAGGAQGRDDLAPAAERASRKLAAALSHLQRRSRLTINGAARQADLSPSYISRVLAGERIPSWPVVHMLATIFGGSAAQVRILWEGAHGIACPTRQSVVAAAARLRDALRGLHLAAGAPPVEALCAGREQSVEVAQDVLRGEIIPDWGTTGFLVARLGGHPLDVRPLWEDVHYAFLISHDVFPSGGLPSAGLPGAESGDVTPLT